jgi:hypothetical protein
MNNSRRTTTVKESEVCALCSEPIEHDDELAPIINMVVHRECSLRSVLGGIGHLIDHAHFCHGKGPDAGLDYRTSALMVDVWVHRKSVEEAVKIR